MHWRTVHALLVLALPSLAVSPGFQNDWYVDQNAPACATGHGGPQDPFCTIGDAILAASEGDRILVSAGTYVENLVLDKDLELIGGFGGGITIVDGGQLGSVVSQTAGTIVALERLVITRGRAPAGGGIHVAEGAASVLTMTNVTVTGNTARHTIPEHDGRGGGLYVSASATVNVTESSFGNNTALGPPHQSYIQSVASGGAIFNRGVMSIRRTSLYGNCVRAYLGVRAGEYGNAVSNHGTLTMSDSLVIRNGIFHVFGTPSGGGRAEAVFSASPMAITNTTVTENVSGRDVFLGGRTYEPALSGPITVQNGIVWNHPGDSIEGAAQVRHSIVEGGWPGDGNLDQDPLFVDPVNGRWDLRAGSPCVDAGDPAAAPRGVDFDGNVRTLDGRLVGAMRVDMGAFELSNVRLSVIGRTLNDATIEATGTPGLEVFLAVARSPGESRVPPWGSTLFAPDSLWFVLGLGPIPVSRRLPIPHDASLYGRGDEVVLQALALGRPLGGGRIPGNLSNSVALTLD